MLEKPNVTEAQIEACLVQHYGLTVTALQFLPIGYDARSFLYEVTAQTGVTYFLKLRSVPVPLPVVEIPGLLLARGFKNFIAPLPTLGGALVCPLERYTAILYPFIPGRTGMAGGLSYSQWLEFGRALQAVHSSGLAEQFQDQLPRETFSFAAGQRVRQVLAAIDNGGYTSLAAQQIAAFCQQQRPLIQHLLERGEALGHELQSQAFDHVLCHTDCHTANILLGENGGLYLIDWDGPMIAPRERDLFFVVGPPADWQAKSAEELAFFQGYGSTPISRTALAYYRLERTIEDLGEAGYTAFLDPNATEAEREETARFIPWLFAPGNSVEMAQAEDQALGS